MSSKSPADRNRCVENRGYLLAAGAASRLPPSPSPEPGVRIAFVADPEGNLVELLDRS